MSPHGGGTASNMLIRITDISMNDISIGKNHTATATLAATRRIPSSRKRGGKGMKPLHLHRTHALMEGLRRISVRSITLTDSRNGGGAYEARSSMFILAEASEASHARIKPAQKHGPWPPWEPSQSVDKTSSTCARTRLPPGHNRPLVNLLNKLLDIRMLW